MSVETESVTPDPGHRAPRRPRIRRQSGWTLAVPLVLAAAGAVFAASALTAQGTDLRAGRRTALTDLVRAQEQKVRAADAAVFALQNEVIGLSEGATDDAELRAATAQADDLAGPAGLTALTGPGLSVVLDDAPRDQTGLPDGVTNDDLVVHQQDVQAVVNALWAGGAEAMQLMDQRVIATSAVRCVGNTLVLQGRVYSPPFRVTAIGDAGRMREALDRSPGVSTYRQFVEVVGLGYQVAEVKEATLPPFEGSLRMAGASGGGAS